MAQGRLVSWVVVAAAGNPNRQLVVSSSSSSSSARRGVEGEELPIHIYGSAAHSTLGRPIAAVGPEGCQEQSSGYQHPRLATGAVRQASQPCAGPPPAAGRQWCGRRAHTVLTAAGGLAGRQSAVAKRTLHFISCHFDLKATLGMLYFTI